MIYCLTAKLAVKCAGFLVTTQVSKCAQMLDYQQ